MRECRRVSVSAGPSECGDQTRPDLCIARREAQISAEEAQAGGQDGQGLAGGAPPPPPSALVMTGTLRRYSEHVECLAARVACDAERRVALRLQALNQLCAGK